MGFDAQSQGQGAPVIKILFRKDEHVAFTWNMITGDVSATADKEVEVGTDNYYTLQLPDLVPGHTYFMAIANYGDSAILQGVFASFSTTPVVIDGGTPDGSQSDGAVTTDGGTPDGAEIDGGSEPDAAGTPDTGVSDTGVTDTGTIADTGVKPAGDAGGQGGADAGPTEETDAGGGGTSPGCSCSTIGP